MSRPSDKKRDTNVRRISRLPLVAALLIGWSLWPAAAQDRGNGTIIKDEPCALPPLTYEQDTKQFKAFYEREAVAGQGHGLTALPYQETYAPSEAEWNAMRTHEGFVCHQLRYMSDGLEINGLLYAPENIVSRTLPVVILNRGGNRDFTAWTPWRFIRTAYPLGQAGFVVLASQYRGGGGSQGQDEFGGADVDDVLNQILTAKSFSYADTNNVFMLGISRGGMMTYLSIKHNAKIRAAAVLSGLADLRQNLSVRPEMRKEFVETIPAFEQHEAESLQDRSAVLWADKIDVPVLLMHGTADWRVYAVEALHLAQELQRANKTYQLMMFANDSHGLPAHRSDVYRATIAWFKSFTQ
jgi:dipeptidyl aminopeptidase/acylaminoacyl peptidase